jgi:hypothetical protein
LWKSADLLKSHCWGYFAYENPPITLSTEIRNISEVFIIAGLSA